MPQSDRFWWVQSFFALLFAAASVIIGVMLAVTALPLNEEFGESITGYLLGALGLSVLILAFSVGFAVASTRARYRHRLRRSAISGVADAVPLASIPVAHPEKAPDVGQTPLVLEWRATRMIRLVYVPFLGLQLALVVVELVAYGVFLVITLVNTSQEDLFSATILALVAGLLASVGLLVGIGALIRRVFPFIWGKPYGVTATSEGIRGLTTFGTRRFVPWDEARLFEVTATTRTVTQRTFFLHGAHGSVAWQDNPAKYGEFAPQGMTPSEMAQRLQWMVDLIAARTGLQPRTFSKALQPRGDRAKNPERSPVQSPERSNRVLGIVAVFIFIVIDVGVAALAYVEPVTSSQILNIVIAGSVASLALGLLVAMVRLLVASVLGRSTQPTAPVLPAEATFSDMPDVVYELATGVGWWARIVLVLWGAALSVNLFPGLFQFFQTPLSSLLSNNVPLLTDSGFSFVLNFVLLLYGFLGFFLLVYGLRGVGVTFRLDSAGLSRGLGGASNTLLFENVSGVVARVQRGAIISYRALDTNAQPQIVWPAKPSRVLTRRPTPQKQSVSPDELAALVAKRAGKTIEVREAQ